MKSLKLIINGCAVLFLSLSLILLVAKALKFNAPEFVSVLLVYLIPIIIAAVSIYVFIELTRIFFKGVRLSSPKHIVTALVFFVLEVWLVFVVVGICFKRK